MPEKLTKRLKKLKKKTGMTQYDVASAMSVDQSTVSRWESGKATPVGLYLSSLETLFATHGV